MHAVVNLAVAGCSDGDPVVREVDSFAAPVPFPAGDAGAPVPDVDVIVAPCAPPQVSDDDRMALTSCFCDDQGWCAEVVPYSGGALTDVAETEAGDLWVVVDQELYARRGGAWLRAVFAEQSEFVTAVESWGDTVWVATTQTIYRVEQSDIGYAPVQSTAMRTMVVDAETGDLWWGDGAEVGKLDALSWGAGTTEAGHVLWVAPTGEVFARDEENLKRRSLTGTWEELLSVIGQSPDTKFTGWSAENFWFVDRWWRDGNVKAIAKPFLLQDFPMGQSLGHLGSAVMVAQDRVLWVADFVGRLFEVREDGSVVDASPPTGPVFRVSRSTGKTYVAGVHGGLWAHQDGTWDELLPRTCAYYGLNEDGRVLTYEDRWAAYGRAFDLGPERNGCHEPDDQLPPHFSLSMVQDLALLSRRGRIGVLQGPDDIEWLEQPAPPDVLVSGLIGTSLNDLWGGTDLGDLLHWDGDGWTRVQTNLNDPVVPVGIDDEGSVVALNASKLFPAIRSMRAETATVFHAEGGRVDSLDIGFVVTTFTAIGEGRVLLAGTKDDRAVWAVADTKHVGEIQDFGPLGDDGSGVASVALARGRFWFLTERGIWSIQRGSIAPIHELDVADMQQIVAMPSGDLLLLGRDAAALVETSASVRLAHHFEGPPNFLFGGSPVFAGTQVAVPVRLPSPHAFGVAWLDLTDLVWARDRRNVPTIGKAARWGGDATVGVRPGGGWGGPATDAWRRGPEGGWEQLLAPDEPAGTVRDVASGFAGEVAFAVDSVEGAWLDVLAGDGAWRRESLPQATTTPVWRRVFFDPEGTAWMLVVSEPSGANGSLWVRPAGRDWEQAEPPAGATLWRAEFLAAPDRSWWAVVDQGGAIHQRVDEGWFTWASPWEEGAGQFASETILDPSGSAWSTRVGGPNPGWRLNLARPGCVREFRAPLGGHPDFVGIDGDRLIGITARGQVTWASLDSQYVCVGAQ